MGALPDIKPSGGFYSAPCLDAEPDRRREHPPRLTPKPEGRFGKGALSPPEEAKIKRLGVYLVLSYGWEQSVQQGGVGALRNQSGCFHLLLFIHTYGVSRFVIVF